MRRGPRHDPLRQAREVSQGRRDVGRHGLRAVGSLAVEEQCKDPHRGRGLEVVEAIVDQDAVQGLAPIVLGTSDQYVGRLLWTPCEWPLKIPSIRPASPAPRRAASFVSLPPVATYTRCPIRRSRSIADLASGNRAFTWARASRSSSRERRSGSPVAGGMPIRSNISWRWRASSSSTTSPYPRASQSASFARRV